MPVAEDQSWRLLEWLSGIATLIASASLGFVMKSRDRLTKLEERVAQHESTNQTRGPVLYDTQRRVDKIETEMGHIQQKLEENGRQGAKILSILEAMERRTGG